MSKTLTCYHCSSTITPSESIEADLAGVKHVFCCSGCMAIAQTIHGEGLEVFYARRTQSSDKPSAHLANNQIPDKLKPYDDPSLLVRFTRPHSDSGDLETTLRLEKIRCAACIWLCEQHLRRSIGVNNIQINYVTQKVLVRFSPSKTSLAKLLFEIERIGYEAWPFEPSLSLDKAKKERRQLLTRLGVAMLGMVVVTLMWSSAGVVTRQLEHAASFETTFWRSLFCVVFVGAAMLVRERAVLHLGALIAQCEFGHARRLRRWGAWAR